MRKLPPAIFLTEQSNFFDKENTSNMRQLKIQFHKTWAILYVLIGIVVLIGFFTLLHC